MEGTVAESADDIDAVGKAMYQEEAEFERRQNWWDGEQSNVMQPRGPIHIVATVTVCKSLGRAKRCNLFVQYWGSGRKRWF